MHRPRLIAALASVSLIVIAAACGDDDDVSIGGGDNTGADETIVTLPVTSVIVGEAESSVPSIPVPETTSPDTTAGETTAPETAAPETTAPETTAAAVIGTIEVPGTSVAETSAVETTAVETTAVETTAVETTVVETTEVPETTLRVPETTAVESTVVETTEVPETTVVETTDVEIPAPGTTVTETTLVETTVPDSVPIPELLPLNEDGLGLVEFGDEPEAAIAAVTGVLGAPTEDTGWADPLSISACPGTEVRRVSWGALSLFFGDESPVEAGTPHLFAYAYGSAEDLTVEPVGLATDQGIGLGTTAAYLEAAYPGVVIEPGEEGVIEPSFFVDENLSGRLTGASDDDLVTVIIGGDPCGV